MSSAFRSSVQEPVSVLLPAFNAERYISDAIQSILQQTHSNFELVVVDDGSSDRTGAIVEAYCAKDSRVRLIQKENGGIVSALNRGLLECSHDLVARMDADDLAHPDRLRRQVERMQLDMTIIACGTSVELFGSRTGDITYPKGDRDCRRMLLLYPCFAHPSVVFRRSLFPTPVTYRTEYEYAEDYELWTRAALFGKLCNLTEPLLRYRTHPDQTSTTRRKLQISRHAEIAARQFSSNSRPLDPQLIDSLLSPGTGRQLRLMRVARLLQASYMNKARLRPRLMDVMRLARPIFARGEA